MRRKQVALSLAFVVGMALAAVGYAQAPTRIVGSVVSVSGHQITIQPDKGSPSVLTVSDTARILRTQPGAKKLSDAVPITLNDLSAGDRVLAVVNADTATVIIAMKKADIAQKRAAEAADWKLRGTGGIVRAVDAAAGTVTIASGVRTLTIHTTPATVVRRYSPDSARFQDTRTSTLGEIRVGDQLRVRGDRNGLEINADEIIAGTFRDIAGTVLATDPAANTVTLRNQETKKPVVIHVTADSQLHRLPSGVAEDLVAHLQRPGAEGGKKEHGRQHGAASAQTAAAQPVNASEASAPESEQQRDGRLSRALESAPVITVADLHKGDALMIVATEGTPESATAVTLLAGVGPILEAFPSGSQSVFSASWNLNESGTGAGMEGGGPGAGASAGQGSGPGSGSGEESNR